MIEIKVGKTFLIDWRTIKPLQPDNAKNVFNYKHIENSILKHGFAVPFYVWENKGEYYCIDGHIRTEVLHNLGEQVPKKLPCTTILAKDRKDAIEILIECYNIKSNPFNVEVLEEFIELELVEVNLESVNVVIEKEIDYSDKNKEIDIDELDTEMVLKLKFTEQEYQKVKESLSKIAPTPEQAIWKLLKL